MEICNFREYYSANFKFSPGKECYCGLIAGIIGFLIAGLIVGYLTDIEIEHVSIISHLTSSNTENAAINDAVAGFIGFYFRFNLNSYE